ncbi:hypothetical protein FLJC2902T_29340 [Flavobacterium limnosediminis JC2902]|uniref:YARHG domain-containing protein n=1 Tax=Flavobacterium limnosediminis JC2902 TaxID=1341181 RepID=V6SI39_9FLAO|nr:hypothetical protein [Flavobacterium limnosediminis]ESU26119.1 hypothetical protein FLJC2902T_29340 [Flavobacterium limnosediminis JC2902]
MKFKLTLLSLLLCFIANARFEKASILFNDGHSEGGFVKSFLETTIKISLFQSNSKERDLNLDDKTIKFKTSEEGETRTISIDDINEVTIFNESGSTTTFRAIFLKDVNSKGEITDSGCKVFLPYVKRGKINIYGIRYTETSTSNLGPKYGSVRSEEIRFYYQNENENYAINNNREDLTIIFNIKNRMINPLKDLFKDCPTIMEKLNAASEGDLGWFKMDKETKDKLKEFRKLDRKEREKLAVYHYHNFYNMEKMITEYEQCK